MELKRIHPHTMGGAEFEQVFVGSSPILNVEEIVLAACREVRRGHLQRSSTRAQQYYSCLVIVERRGSYDFSDYSAACDIEQKFPVFPPTITSTPLNPETNNLLLLT